MLITLDPTGARPGDQASRQMAARRPLAGARVGLASNGLGLTEDLLTQVYRPQKESAGTGGMFLIRKLQRSTPQQPEDWAKLLSDADVAIADFGGCGSGSTRSIRGPDGTGAGGNPQRRAGPPGLLPGVRAMTRLARMPGYPYVVVDRSRTSLCDWDDAMIESVAKEAAAEAAALLSREP